MKLGSLKNGVWYEPTISQDINGTTVIAGITATTTSDYCYCY